MDAERGPLEHGGESARSVSEMMNRGYPRSGLAICALAQGIQGGYALVTPLAVEAAMVKLTQVL